MPYVRRDATGAIESLHRHAAEVAEFLPEQHPEVSEFLAAGVDSASDGASAGSSLPPLAATGVHVVEPLTGHFELPRHGAGDAAQAPAAGEQFAALDADLVRVIEDVIDALISRNVINITDLPVEAQTKLFSRKSYRDRTQRDALELFGKNDERSL